jgi:hypothetical protein
MLKVIILGCAICAGAGGTAFWMQSGSKATADPVGTVSLISIQDMHANAHLDNLPIQTFDAH